VEKVIEDLKASGFDYIICDSPAGIEKGAQLALYFADEALIVTNPEVSSVRDSDRILGILQAKSKRAERGEAPIVEHLVLTRYNPNRVESGEMLSVEDVIDLLSVNLLGAIPESEDVLNASNAGSPVVLEEKSAAAEAYKDVVERFLGEEVEHRFLTVEKKGLFKKLFGKS
jgi:septum site-determining protein MinD